MARTWNVFGPNSSTSKPKCFRIGSCEVSKPAACGGKVTAAGASRTGTSAALAVVLLHQLLEQDALMRGVLIDQVQSVRALGHNVGRTDLPDQPEQAAAVVQHPAVGSEDGARLLRLGPICVGQFPGRIRLATSR